MTGPNTYSAQHLEGFEAPIHGSLGSPILLGGAPRGIAILNGTIAAAVGLGLQQWLAGLALWAVGHSIAVFAARRDPDFAPVLRLGTRKQQIVRIDRIAEGRASRKGNRS